MWRQDLRVALFAWGVGAVVSHRGAAALWRLAGFAPGEVELTVPRSRRRGAPGIIHRNRLFDADMTEVEGIALTTPARTLIDVAAVRCQAVIEEAPDDALRKGLVTLPRIRWHLDLVKGGGGRRGVATVERLLDARLGSSVPQSVFETRLLRELRRANLPMPEVQHRIHEAGRHVATVDFAYPSQHLAIEADGYRWHSGRTSWQHDRRRRNALTLLGWRTVHVTWDDLRKNPEVVLGAIGAALAPRE